MVRTLEEVQGSRLAVNIHEVAFAGNELTVRLTIDGSLSTVPLGGQEDRLYTAEEVGDLQAALAARAERISELELEVHDERERADQNKDWAKQAELKMAQDAETHVRQITALNGDVAYWRKAYEEREQARAALEKRLDSEEIRTVLLQEKSQGEEIRKLRTRISEETKRADQNRDWAERAEKNGARLSRALVAAEKSLHEVQGLLTTDEVVQACRMDHSTMALRMSHAISAALRALDRA
jgi:cell division protein FtsL